MLGYEELILYLYYFLSRLGRGAHDNVLAKTINLPGNIRQLDDKI